MFRRFKSSSFVPLMVRTEESMADEQEKILKMVRYIRLWG
jgi:hypothetical protein